MYDGERDGHFPWILMRALERRCKMTAKKKNVSAAIGSKLARRRDRIFDLCLIIIAATIISPIGNHVISSTLGLDREFKRDMSYRFCLAEADGDACVSRPDVTNGRKFVKSPKRLLRYFDGIPERVQRNWRVWIMDVENSKTLELTVEEFYAWIDNVWAKRDRAEVKPRRRHLREGRSERRAG